MRDEKFYTPPSPQKNGEKPRAVLKNLKFYVTAEDLSEARCGEAKGRQKFTKDV